MLAARTPNSAVSGERSPDRSPLPQPGALSTAPEQPAGSQHGAGGGSDAGQARSRPASASPAPREGPGREQLPQQQEEREQSPAGAGDELPQPGGGAAAAAAAGSSPRGEAAPARPGSSSSPPSPRVGLTGWWSWLTGGEEQKPPEPTKVQTFADEGFVPPPMPSEAAFKH